MMKSEFLVLAALLMSATVGVADDRVLWSDGQWDVQGMPRGKLLTENPGWWGPQVRTGVTYRYAEPPQNPGDRIRNDKGTFGRRLIDGDVPCGWHRPVGQGGGKGLSVAFDFNRSCSFAEVDLLSERTPVGEGDISVRLGGDEWLPVVSFKANGARTRVKLPTSVSGRYLRVRFRGAERMTYLDEILVWGDVASGDGQEEKGGIRRGDVLKFPTVQSPGLTILPLAEPSAASRRTAKSGRSIAVRMSRNETESGYAAIVNNGPARVTVPLSVSGLGKGISGELLVGGVVRTRPPQVKLTEKQLIDLLVKDENEAAKGVDDDLEVLPFFFETAKPDAVLARRYLANPEQVLGFPSAVEIESGEGCVVMWRLTSSAAPVGRSGGFLAAGNARLPLEVTVHDISLADVKLWIHAYASFTRQYPFESESRVRQDVKRLADLGVSSCCWGFPVDGSKPALMGQRVPHLTYGISHWMKDGRLFADIYHGKMSRLNETQQVCVAESAHSVVEQAKALHLPPERYVVFLPDEPGLKNAALFGHVIDVIKRAEPTLQVYMNPCFWRRGFPKTEEMMSALEPYYHKVDVSCPLRNLVRKGGALTDRLWTQRRQVNATYLHPARRAGRSIAWLAFECGLNGFAYYCYYAPRGNPWDIRTWKELNYDYQMVFPLENDVAITPIYETMREAWEDYRLLESLKRAGKDDLLQEVLDMYENATDYGNVENLPNGSDFKALRDKILCAF